MYAKFASVLTTSPADSDCTAELADVVDMSKMTPTWCPWLMMGRHISVRGRHLLKNGSLLSRATLEDFVIGLPVRATCNITEVGQTVCAVSSLMSRSYGTIL